MSGIKVNWPIITVGVVQHVVQLKIDAYQMVHVRAFYICLTNSVFRGSDYPDSCFSN